MLDYEIFMSQNRALGCVDGEKKRKEMGVAQNDFCA